MLHIPTLVGTKNVLIFSTIIVIVSIVCGIRGAYATEPSSWVNQEPVTVESKTISIESNTILQSELPGCVISRGFVTGTASGSSHEMMDICFLQGKSVKLALYQNIGWSSRSLAVQYPGDQDYHTVTGMGADTHLIRFLPKSDTLILSDIRYYWQNTTPNLVTYTNVAAAFQVASVDSLTGQVKNYKFNPNLGKKWLNYTYNNQQLYARAYEIVSSQNEQFLFVKVGYRGSVRIDLQANDTKIIDNTGGSEYGGRHNPYPGTVSDNGRYALMGQPLLIYDIEGCGDDFNADFARESNYGYVLQNPCQKRDLRGNLSTVLPCDTYRGSKYSFDNEDNTVRITVPLGGGQYCSPSVTASLEISLHTSRYTPTPPLSYLALGDSYSSGEGDTTYIPTSQKKWYREYTDNEEDKNKNIPREKCHISTRSYPYLVAWSLGLGYPSPAQGTKWQTIACSGATTWDIAHGDNSGYKGQGKGAAWPWSRGGVPRLEDFTDIPSFKEVALNEFIPGRNEQIEFVKKYQPKFVTLTAGGNDVGFGDKVAACIKGKDDCRYVTDQGRRDVGVEIQNHLGTLIKLYKDIKAASPSSKIYVVNYPQFINGDENASCNSSAVWDTGPKTRKLFKEGYSYMNQVIERATQIAGVYYVDVEDALEGHLLCDGTAEKYVTGFVHRGRLERQETFHPNSQGHRAISQKLLQKLYATEGQSGNPLEGSNNIPAPALPSYLNPSGTIDRNIKTQEIVSEKMEKGGTYNMSTSKYTFKADSVVTNTVYSEPIDLGTVNAESDGSLSAQVIIPNNIPAGYHTLVATGESYSGEPIAIQQTIEIQGTDPNDRDENGISDNEQPCGLYITGSGIDANLNGIDDACDPEISTSPQLYRLRQGDPTRTYAGQPEKAHYLYIERNTRASSITGITGDYDPDGDGWAIVGASQGKEYTATSVPDTAPAANFTITGDGTPNSPYAPIISLRAGGWGCVQYKPTSLSKVTASQSRTLTRIATNTNTCRQEPPEDDVDGNGKPDNIQPLYTARSGDSAKGEDPDRLYLYRNFHAAETRLGISDYTPTGTAANTIAALPLIPTISTPPNDPIFGRSQEPIQAWNLLATSKAGEPIPQFNKLVIIDDNGTPSPIILTKNQNGQCIAYKPQNVGIIKFNQQNSLIKTTNTPQGESCD